MKRLQAYLEDISYHAMPRRGCWSPRWSTHWWNDGIANLRRECILALRGYQRAGRGAPRGSFYSGSFELPEEICVFRLGSHKTRIVLLHKGPGKSIDQLGSFRPISLLNGAGKLFERIILNRISPLLGALPRTSSGSGPARALWRQ